MSMYSLTHLTGRKRNADRKIIIATVETSKAGFLVSIAAIVVSIPATAIFIAFFGPVAMIIVPTLFVSAALLLFRYRSQKGLKLPMYKTLIDTKAAKAVKGHILVCGVPIQRHSVMGNFVQSSEPVRVTATNDDLFSNTAIPPLTAVHGTATAQDPSHIKSPTDFWD